MQLSHTHPVVSASFDEPNLLSPAGLLPLIKVGEQAGLGPLGDEHLSLPSDKGANAGRKLSSPVPGMAAGAESNDDMAMLRHGAMGKIFPRPYAPSTLGYFLRTFTFGHARQADAIAPRFLGNRPERTEFLGRDGEAGTVKVHIDDTITEVHG